MKVKEREEALRLRLDDQLSYGEISRRLNVPKSTLSGWLEDIPLSKERIHELQYSDASREKFRTTMRKKRDAREQKVYTEQLKKFKTISDQALFVAGLMLYLAEGDKKNYGSISIANTDPAVIKFFVWWLGEFLDIPQNMMKAELHLYPKFTPELGHSSF
jgi:transposase-like protein